MEMVRFLMYQWQIWTCFDLVPDCFIICSRVIKHIHVILCGVSSTWFLVYSQREYFLDHGFDCAILVKLLKFSSFISIFPFVAGADNAANVSLEVLKQLPPLQEREQSRGRFGGGGRGGFGGRGGNRFSGGRGGGFSDRRNDRFSGGSRGSKGRGGGNRW